MEKEVLVASEVAEIFRCSVKRVYDLARQRKIPGVLPFGDRQYRFSARAIYDFINSENNKKEEIDETK